MRESCKKLIRSLCTYSKKYRMIHGGGGGGCFIWKYVRGETQSSAHAWKLSENVFTHPNIFSHLQCHPCDLISTEYSWLVKSTIPETNLNFPVDTKYVDYKQKNAKKKQERVAVCRHWWVNTYLREMKWQYKENTFVTIEVNKVTYLKLLTGFVSLFLNLFSVRIYFFI